MGSCDAAIKVEKKREGTYGDFTVGKFSEREFALHEKIEIRIENIMRSFANIVTRLGIFPAVGSFSKTSLTMTNLILSIF